MTARNRGIPLCGRHLDIAFCADGRIGQFDGAACHSGSHRDVAFGGHFATHLHFASRCQREVCCRSRHFTQHPHTHAGIGSHQADRVSVHTAQNRGVNRVSTTQCRWIRIGRSACDFSIRRCVLFARAGKAVRCSTCIHAQVVGVHCAIELDGPGHQIEQLHTAHVQTGTSDQNVTVLHRHTHQTTSVAKIWRTSRHGQAIGVDEAAPGASDTVQVGHQHIGFGTCNFHEACQARTLTPCHHLVQDHARGVNQVGVGQNLTRQLRLRRHARIDGRVVQHHAASIHIEFAVLVG